MNRFESQRLSEHPGNLSAPLQKLPLIQKDAASSLQGQMQLGKRLILKGFAICLFGVIAYCWVTLSVAPHERPDAAHINLSLLVSASGFICWLIGAIRYFSAAIAAGEDSSDLF